MTKNPIGMKKPPERKKGSDGHDYTIFWDKNGKNVGHLECRKCDKKSKHPLTNK